MAQPQDLPSIEDRAAPPTGLTGAVHGFISFCLEGGIHLWVRLTGRLVRQSEALWLLVEFISRRMDQLNFPISSLEVAKGMTSEVVQLVEPATGRIVNTGWLRRLKSSGRGLYAALYSATP